MRQCLTRCHGRRSPACRAPETPDPEQPDLWSAVHRRRSSQLPRPPTVALHHNAATSRLTGRPATDALRGASLADARLALHPPLDVQRTSDNSSEAPCLMTHGDAGPTRDVHNTSRVTSSVRAQRRKSPAPSSTSKPPQHPATQDSALPMAYPPPAIPLPGNQSARIETRLPQQTCAVTCTGLELSRKVFAKGLESPMFQAFGIEIN